MELVIKTTDELARECNCSVSQFEGKQNAIKAFFQTQLKADERKAGEIALGMVLWAKKNPALLADTSKIDTFVGSVCAAVNYDLSVNPAARECYFVPFKGAVQLIPSPRGMIKIAQKSGMVAAIESWVIFRGEQYRYDVYDGQVIFNYRPSFDRVSEWGNILAVVVKITNTKGFVSYSHLSFSDLEKRRLTSAMAAQDVNSKDSPYKKWPEEMAIAKGIKKALSHLAATSENLPYNLPANPAAIDETIYTITDNGVVSNEREFDDSGLSKLNKDAEIFMADLQNTAPIFELKDNRYKDVAKRKKLRDLKLTNEALYNEVLPIAQAFIENVEKNQNEPILPNAAQ